MLRATGPEVIMEAEIKKNNLRQTRLPNVRRPKYFAKDLRLDFEKLAQEIIRQLRGPLSQRALSEQMGFSFNQVGKWESGATQIKWGEFLSLAQTLQTPIENYFRYSFVYRQPEFTVDTTLQTLVSRLNLLSNREDRMKALGRKWMKGHVNPSFSEVLRVMGSKAPLLFGWLSLFADCNLLASLKDSHEIFLKNVEAVLENPSVVFVNAALHLKRYQELELHDETMLAEHSACSCEELRQALKVLLKFDLIMFDGRKYLPSFFDFSFSGLRHPKLRGLTKAATCLAAARYPDQPIVIDPKRVRNPSQSSVRVVAMSSEAARKIAELIEIFHNQADEIVNADHLDKDNVQIILLHSFASNINSPDINASSTKSPIVPAVQQKG